jgi:hypothetical protein
MQFQRHRSSSKLQFKEINLDSAQSSLAGLHMKPGAVAVPSGSGKEPSTIRISKKNADTLRFVQKSLIEQQQREQQQKGKVGKQSDWDEFDSATVASSKSTRSWWGRPLRRGGRKASAAGADDDDARTVTSVLSRFSLFGGRSKAKKKSKKKLTQERILSEFFDVQSVANDGRLHDRLNQERVVAKFFDVQSVQTETRGSRKRFSFLRRGQREDVETKSVASLGSIGIIFFHPNEMNHGPVPDDETITLASGLFSSANSVIIEESESSSGDDIIEFPVPGDHHLHSSSSSVGTSGSGKRRTPSTSAFIQEVTAAQKLMARQDSVAKRGSLKLPDPPRPSLADFDRWSSQSSVNSAGPAQDTAPVGGVAPKQPSRRRLSYTEGSKDGGAGDQSDEESVVSLLSGIVANYAAAKSEYERRRSTAHRSSSSRVPVKPSLKKDVQSSRASYSVVFDSITIREYARTVGDNPSCTCGPPVTLDWHVVSDEQTSVEDYEASKPAKRTKKQFYLPARLRAMILMEDWGVTDEELKRARREVTYIQYCRERSVAGTGGRTAALERRANGVPKASATQAPAPSDVVGPVLGSMSLPTAESSPLSDAPTGPPSPKTRSSSPPILVQEEDDLVESEALLQETRIPLAVDEDEVMSVSNPQDQQDVTIPAPPGIESSPSKSSKSKLVRQNSLSSLGSLEPIRMTLEPSSRRRMEI